MTYLTHFAQNNVQLCLRNEKSNAYLQSQLRMTCQTAISLDA